MTGLNKPRWLVGDCTKEMREDERQPLMLELVAQCRVSKFMALVTPRKETVWVKHIDVVVLSPPRCVEQKLLLACKRRPDNQSTV